MRRRRICFVSGTRAELGLMCSTLEAIQAHPALQLQIVVTGMHLDPTRGHTARRIPELGWKVDRVVSWPATQSRTALAGRTGQAMAGLAQAFTDLHSDIVLVVGDRVEAFSAASAAHIAGCVVAHVHGGDRALGQVDDSLRHAITKLAHVHFPATPQSAARIARLGEDRWRIHLVGSPGLDDLKSLSTRGERGRVRGETRHSGPIRYSQLLPSPRPSPLRGEGERFALLMLHPVDSDVRVEFNRARAVLRAVESIQFERIVIIYPNNDPGSAGIVRCWRTHARSDRFVVLRDLPRPDFLGLLRRATVLVGNSSSGIIEAASFGTPVVDIGPRQLGRERSKNVVNVPYSQSLIRRALRKIWNHGRPRRFRGANVYGAAGAGRKITQILASIPLDDRIRRKLISY